MKEIAASILFFWPLVAWVFAMILVLRVLGWLWRVVSTWATSHFEMELRLAYERGRRDEREFLQRRKGAPR